jgi:hypothetical protein
VRTFPFFNTLVLAYCEDIKLTKSHFFPRVSANVLQWLGDMSSHELCLDLSNKAAVRAFVEVMFEGCNDGFDFDVLRDTAEAYLLGGFRIQHDHGLFVSDKVNPDQLKFMLNHFLSTNWASTPTVLLVSRFFPMDVMVPEGPCHLLFGQSLSTEMQRPLSDVVWDGPLTNGCLAHINGFVWVLQSDTIESDQHSRVIVFTCNEQKITVRCFDDGRLSCDREGLVPEDIFISKPTETDPYYARNLFNAEDTSLVSFSRNHFTCMVRRPPFSQHMSEPACETSESGDPAEPPAKRKKLSVSPGPLMSVPLEFRVDSTRLMWRYRPPIILGSQFRPISDSDALYVLARAAALRQNLTEDVS